MPEYLDATRVNWIENLPTAKSVSSVFASTGSNVAQLVTHMDGQPFTEQQCTVVPHSMAYFFGQDDE